MAYSFATYPGSDSLTRYSIPFAYLNADHIHVYVDDVEVAFTFPTSGEVELDSPAGAGTIIKVARETPTTRLVDYANGSVLNEATMDLDSNQLVYVVQEAYDNLGLALHRANAAVPFDAEGERITNAGDPVDDQDLVTKLWATTALAAELAQAITAKNASLVAQAAAETAEAHAETAEANAETAQVAAEAALAATQAEHVAAVAAIEDEGDTQVARVITEGDTQAARAQAAADAAEASATTATAQAGISTTQAGISTTKATEASGSADDAAASASAASTSATNATSSAAAAATSASNAGTSETNAAASATAAATSETNAEYYASQAQSAAEGDHNILTDRDAVDCHPQGAITGLTTALDGKAAASHGHAIADTTGLQTALDGKAAASHTHAIANVTGLQTALDGKLGTTAQAADSAKLANMSPATAATASTIAQRDASGNLTAVLFQGTATAARYS